MKTQQSERIAECTCILVGFCAGTLPLGPANNGSNDNPLINSPCDGNNMGNLPTSYFHNCGYLKR